MPVYAVTDQVAAGHAHLDAVEMTVPDEDDQRDVVRPTGAQAAL